MAPAGSLSRCINEWRILTNNNVILNIVKSGYAIQFIGPPSSSNPISSNPKDPIKREALRKEINRHINSGAISMVEKSEDHYVSRVFVVEKKQGGYRMVIDLKNLNNYVNKIHFRMEDKEVVSTLIEKDDFLASIDLKDAFFTIPLNEKSKKFTVFEFENKRYQYNVLPFGLSSSPRIFTKILKCVISFLRSEGLKITAYLDDILICSKSLETIKKEISQTIKLLESLGFVINYKKSNIVPSRKLLHLGFIWDSIEMNIALPEDKITKIKNFAKVMRYKSNDIRSLSSFIGLLVSTKFAFLFAPLHYRRLQFLLIQHFNKCTSWEDKLTLDDSSKIDLDWWINCKMSDLIPVSFINNKTDVTLFVDASLTGWGVYLSSGESTNGFWTEEERKMHINILEMQAILYAILCFKSKFQNKKINIRSDNKTTVFYILKMGGTHSKNLCFLALRIWKLFEENNISCQISHIAGIDNSEADYHSRLIPTHEYAISNSAFNQIQIISKSNSAIDLFASCANHKLPIYASLRADPYASHIDAFSFSWPNHIYCFPPIPLIQRVFQKIVDDGVISALLITPAWSSLSILPRIIKSLYSNPIFIDSYHLEGTLPTRHPFSLMGWPISSNADLTRAFHKKWSTNSLRALPSPHYVHTVDTGSNLCSGLMRKGIEVIFLYH